MLYAIQQDFVDAFGESEAIMLTNLDTPNATEISSAPMDSALRRASNLIDTYCGSRYSLPLNPLPEVVNGYCLDIARYFLDRVRDREDVRQRYEDAIKYLEQVCKGQISLGADQLGVGVNATISTSSVVGARAERAAYIDMSGY
jgi:phage gp36-like protein